MYYTCIIRDHLGGTKGPLSSSWVLFLILSSSPTPYPLPLVKDTIRTLALSLSLNFSLSLSLSTVESMEMEDQYSISDLRHFISRASTGPAQFPPYPPPELFSAHHPHPAQQQPASGQYDMVVMGRHMTAPDHMLHHPRGGSSGLVVDQFNSDSTTTTPTVTATAVTNSSGFDGGGDGGSARWPRQETLTLLEVRSRLDHKFKEANQKGPLWDEVARIMLEEHGYQRSGKKCREKFENLYKYYKKTKEGKAGRQDGKHYRFFRQLEALYGEHSSSIHHHHLTSDTHISGNTPQFYHNPISPQPNNNPSASLSTSSGFDTSSSEDDDVSNGSKKKRKEKRSNWKAKIKEFIDLQMRKIMEKQELWLEKMMKGLEKREQERVEREDEWRKREAARVEREHEFWASERAWIEARDSALMKVLEKITNRGDQWAEPEITRLIQLRTNMESRFEQCGFSEEVLWEDIAAKMVYLGYERSAIVCKEKWNSINKKLQEKGNNRKRKEKNNNYEGGLYMNNNQVNGTNNRNNYEINDPIRLQLNDGSSSSPSSHNSNINVNSANVMNDSCLRFFLGDGDNLGWESNYGVKSQQG